MASPSSLSGAVIFSPLKGRGFPSFPLRGLNHWMVFTESPDQLSGNLFYSRDC